MDDSSFWSDIKKFEDTLAKDPASYCFAPLAELYRKTGLLDDAIATAIKGTTLHPDYVGGYMALGRAYLDKGLKADALDALQRVVSFTPENMLAQKLLCQMYTESGDYTLLKKTVETLLILNPADTESRIILESLERLTSHEQAYPVESGHADGSVSLIDLSPHYHAVDGLEEIEPEEPIDNVPSFLEHVFLSSDTDEGIEEDADLCNEKDAASGIRTATIAELYVAQGHIDQAIEIYRELQEDFAGNKEYGTRITELEQVLSGKGASEGVHDTQRSTGEVFTFQNLATTQETPEELHTSPCVQALESSEPLAALQSWLDTIRGIRECRSGRG